MDLSRLNVSDEFFAGREASAKKALEDGAIANPDETGGFGLRYTRRCHYRDGQ